MKHTLSALFLVVASGAWAHDGGGLAGAHAHASDAWGLLAAAVACVAAVAWRGRR